MDFSSSCLEWQTMKMFLSISCFVAFTKRWKEYEGNCFIPHFWPRVSVWFFSIGTFWTSKWNLWCKEKAIISCFTACPEEPLCQRLTWNLNLCISAIFCHLSFSLRARAKQNATLKYFHLIKLMTPTGVNTNPMFTLWAPVWSLPATGNIWC